MDATTTIRIPTASMHLVHSALERELEIIRINIENTQRKLAEFEEKHQLKSDEFYRKYSEGSMGDSEEIMLWASEYSALLEIRKEYGDLEKVLSTWTT